MLKTIILTLFTFLLQTPSFAEFFSSKSTGLAVFRFADRYGTPRNTALQGAGGALASGDPGILRSNPAAFMPSMNRHQMGLYWTSGRLEQSLGSLHWGFPLGKGFFNIGYDWSQVGTIEGMDENGNPTGRQYKPSNQQFMVAHSLALSKFRFGSVARILSDNLSEDYGDQTALAWALDWGLWYQGNSPVWSGGFSVLDLGRQERAYTDGGTNHAPLNTTLRASLHVRPRNFSRFSLLADAEAPRHTPTRLRLGAEYHMSQQLVLRGGLRRDMVEAGRLLKGILSIDSPEYSGGSLDLFSAGAGLRIGIFQADYALSFFRKDLGYEQRLGLTAFF